MTTNLKPYHDLKDSDLEWMVRIPRHWNTGTIKSLARQGYKTFSDGDWIESPYITSDGIRLVQTGNIGVGVYREKGFRYISDETFLQLNCTEVYPGDVLICRLGDPVARACIAPNLGRRMVTAVDVCILKPRKTVHSKFLVYAMSSQSYLGWVGSLVRGSTRDRVSRSMLGAFSLPLPPLPEQAAIVRYLDHARRRIQGYIRAKHRLLSLLGEQKRAIIHQAITGQIDVRTGQHYSVYKPSGVEWLPDVPEHWEIVQLRRVTLERCDGPFGSGLKSSHYTVDGIRVVRLQNIGDGEFRDADAAFISPDHYASLGDHSVVSGDVLIAGLGDSSNPAGRACVAPETIEPAMVKADCFRFRFDQSRVESRFVAIQLTATSSAASAVLSTGATRQRTNLESTSARIIGIPTLAEQVLILDYIKVHTTGIGAAQRAAERQIKVLYECGARLITEVVTGKIDVRDSVTGLHDVPSIDAEINLHEPAGSDGHPDGDGFHVLVEQVDA